MIKVIVVQESNYELNISFDQMEHLKGEQHYQYPMERKPNAYRSMSIHPPWVSSLSYMVPPTNAPYGNAYNPSCRNHLNHSWGQYAPPASSQYTSSSQPQPPQPTSPVEQAILNLTKLVGDVLEKQKTFNAQLRQRILTVENSLNQKLDGLQSEINQKFDNLQKSISRLANQHDHQEEENPKGECLIDTILGEHTHLQQLWEELMQEPVEALEELPAGEAGGGRGKEAWEEPKSLSFNQSP